jgi:hypothetical protein
MGFGLRSALLARGGPRPKTAPYCDRGPQAQGPKRPFMGWGPYRDRGPWARGAYATKRSRDAWPFQAHASA